MRCSRRLLLRRYRAAPPAVTFVVRDVVVFIRPKKNRLLREQQLRKAGQKQLVLYDAMSHAGVAWRAARASAMASSVVDAAVGGWQNAWVLIEGMPCELALLDACQAAPSALAR
jgi:hypothetical protein